MFEEQAQLADVAPDTGTIALEPIAPVVVDAAQDPIVVAPGQEPLVPAPVAADPQIVQPVAVVEAPVEPVPAPVVQPVEPVPAPVVQPVEPVPAPVVQPVVQPVEPVPAPVVQPVEPVPAPVVQPVEPVVQPVEPVPAPVIQPVEPVPAPVVLPVEPVPTPVVLPVEPVPHVVEPVLGPAPIAPGTVVTEPTGPSATVVEPPLIAGLPVFEPPLVVGLRPRLFDRRRPCPKIAVRCMQIDTCPPGTKKAVPESDRTSWNIVARRFCPVPQCETCVACGPNDDCPLPKCEVACKAPVCPDGFEYGPQEPDQVITDANGGLCSFTPCLKCQPAKTPDACTDLHNDCFFTPRGCPAGHKLFTPVQQRIDASTLQKCVLTGCTECKACDAGETCESTLPRCNEACLSPAVCPEGMVLGPIPHPVEKADGQGGLCVFQPCAECQVVNDRCSDVAVDCAEVGCPAGQKKVTKRSVRLDANTNNNCFVDACPVCEDCQPGEVCPSSLPLCDMVCQPPAACPEGQEFSVVPFEEVSVNAKGQSCIFHPCASCVPKPVLPVCKEVPKPVCMGVRGCPEGQELRDAAPKETKEPDGTACLLSGCASCQRCENKLCPSTLPACTALPCAEPVCEKGFVLGPKPADEVVTGDDGQLCVSSPCRGCVADTRDGCPPVAQCLLKCSDDSEAVVVPGGEFVAPNGDVCRHNPTCSCVPKKTCPVFDLVCKLSQKDCPWGTEWFQPAPVISLIEGLACSKPVCGECRPCSTCPQTAPKCTNQVCADPICPAGQVLSDLPSEETRIGDDGRTCIFQPCRFCVPEPFICPIPSCALPVCQDGFAIVTPPVGAEFLLANGAVCREATCPFCAPIERCPAALDCGAATECELGFERFTPRPTIGTVADTGAQCRQESCPSCRQCLSCPRTVLELPLCPLACKPPVCAAGFELGPVPPVQVLHDPFTCRFQGCAECVPVKAGCPLAPECPLPFCVEGTRLTVGEPGKQFLAPNGDLCREPAPCPSCIPTTVCDDHNVVCPALTCPDGQELSNPDPEVSVDQRTKRFCLRPKCPVCRACLKCEPTPVCPKPQCVELNCPAGFDRVSGSVYKRLAREGYDACSEYHCDRCVERVCPKRACPLKQCSANEVLHVGYVNQKTGCAGCPYCIGLENVLDEAF